MLRFHSDPLAPGCFVYVLKGLTCTTSTAHQIAQSGVCYFSLFQLILNNDMSTR